MEVAAGKAPARNVSITRLLTTSCVDSLASSAKITGVIGLPSKASSACFFLFKAAIRLEVF